MVTLRKGVKTNNLPVGRDVGRGRIDYIVKGEKKWDELRKKRLLGYGVKMGRFCVWSRGAAHLIGSRMQSRKISYCRRMWIKVMICSSVIAAKGALNEGRMVINL